MTKAMRVWALLALFSTMATIASAQSAYRDPQTIIDEGIAFYDKGDYNKAIELYATVPPASHLYPWACYEWAMALSGLDDYNASLAKIAEARWLGYAEPELDVMTGNVLDDMGKTDEAIGVLLNALKKYPNNQGLLYNLGICYLNQRKPQKAEEVLIRSLRINPYHNRSHQALAKANYMMGRPVQTYLAQHMAVMLSPRIAVVADIEKYLTGRNDSVVDPVAFPYGSTAEAAKWSRLKYLMQNQSGYQGNADYSYKPDYLVLRHCHYLFRNLEFDGADTSFYNQFYVRLMADLYAGGWFETYANHAFTNADNDAVDQWLAQNKKKVEAFFDYVRGALNRYRQFGFSVANEKSCQIVRQYNDDGKLYAIGGSTANVNDSENGPWVYVGGKGSIDQKLTYVNGQINGEGRMYYPNGTLKQLTVRQNGEFEGEQKTFYANGAPEDVYTFKSGLRHGPEKHLTASGLQESVYGYVEGKLTGPAEINYFNQGYSRRSNYAADKFNGEVTETWADGKPKLKALHVDGYFNGLYESYFPNGQPESKGTFAHGYKSGKWLVYHYNGKLKMEAQYGDSGKYEGTIRWFDMDGNPEAVEDSYKDGKLTGTRTDYFAGGMPRSVLQYANDKLVSAIAYNETGDIMHDAKLGSDSVLDVRYFYGNGAVRAEGSFTNSKINGLWKKYNPHGLLAEERTYLDNMEHGPQTTYYANGKVKASYQCDSNRIVGAYIVYSPFGQYEEVSQYNKNGLNGVSNVYYPNGALSRSADYIDGERSGRTIHYSPSGKKTLEVFYDDGREQRSVFYDGDEKVLADVDYRLGPTDLVVKYANGQLMKRVSVVDNLYHGNFETWFPNGQLKSSSPFRYGAMDGTETYYNHKGEVTSTHQLRNGKKDGQSIWYLNGKVDYVNPYIYGIDHGLTIDYHENGTVWRKMEYRNDERTGYSEYYATDGTPMYRLLYASGSIVGVSSPQANGSWGNTEAVNAGTYTITARYANGKTSMTAQLKNGQLNGLQTEYHPNGVTMAEANYENDSFHGLRTRYYPNGKVMLQRNYMYGDQQGAFARYFENGTKEQEGTFEMDKETGEWRYFDRTGKLTESLFYYNGEVFDIKTN